MRGMHVSERCLFVLVRFVLSIIAMLIICLCGYVYVCVVSRIDAIGPEHSAALSRPHRPWMYVCICSFKQLF